RFRIGSLLAVSVCETKIGQAGIVRYFSQSDGCIGALVSGDKGQFTLVNGGAYFTTQARFVRNLLVDIVSQGLNGSVVASVDIDLDNSSTAIQGDIEAVVGATDGVVTACRI